MCYSGFHKARGNLLCSIHNTVWQGTNKREFRSAASEDECCTLRSTIDDPSNPITAWQFEANVDGSGGTCTFVKQKLLNGRSKPIGFYAQKSCKDSQGHDDTFTWFTNIQAPVACAEFATKVADVTGAKGVELPTGVGANTIANQNVLEQDGVLYALKKDNGRPYVSRQGVIAAENDPDAPATKVGKGFSADDCCAVCRDDASCSAWQLREADVCVTVDGAALLTKPEVDSLDIEGWAKTTQGAGFLYHRPALARIEPSPPPPTPDATPAPVPAVEVGVCANFAKLETKGKTLLAGDVISARARSDPSKTIIWNQVFEWESCCEIASRYACTDNPVVMYQLVGSQCILKRKSSVSGLVAEAASAVASTLVPCDGCSDDEYEKGHIFYSEAPRCRNANNELSPCAANGREGLAAAVCTGNLRETCFFDVSCKAGGIGCNAGGFESCRFCGFDFSSTGGTDYSSVPCPGTVVETTSLTTVSVAGTCPSVCDGNVEHTCYYDASCEDPYHPNHKGGLGCNAGGKGQRCRFCGFGLYSEIACPDPGSLLNAAAEPINAEEEEPGQGTLVTGVTLMSFETEVLGDVPTTPEYIFLSADGKRCEDEGHATIESVNECTEAADALGYLTQDKDGEVKVQSYWDRAFGCSWHRFGDVEFFGGSSSRSLSCTHRGYAGCMCRKKMAIENACDSAMGAGTSCVAGSMTTGATCGDASGRRLQTGESYTKMTLTVTKDASMSTNTADALLNDNARLASALGDAGTVRVGNPTYTTTLTIISSGNVTEEQQAAMAAIAADALATSVASSFAAYNNEPLERARAAASSAPSPPCLTCGAVVNGVAVEGWAVAVICACVVVTCLGIAGLVVCMRLKEQKARPPANAATTTDSVTLNAIPPTKTVEVVAPPELSAPGTRAAQKA
jgi:hypothetical protein